LVLPKWRYPAPDRVSGLANGSTRRPLAKSLHAGAGMPEQQHKKNDEHDQPNQTVTAAPVVATAISVIAATSAEQQNEDDDQEEQGHDAIVNAARAVLTAGAQDKLARETKSSGICALTRRLIDPRTLPETR
jgi:hypothetical protein